MSKLSVKMVNRLKLPKGRFQYVVLLCREVRNAKMAKTNAGTVEAMRDTLRGTCGDRYRLVHVDNYRGRRVYTHLYLEGAMDLAMLKLAHHDAMFKIYKIRVSGLP